MVNPDAYIYMLPQMDNQILDFLHTADPANNPKCGNSGPHV